MNVFIIASINMIDVFEYRLSDQKILCPLTPSTVDSTSSLCLFVCLSVCGTVYLSVCLPVVSDQVYYRNHGPRSLLWKQHNVQRQSLQPSFQLNAQGLQRPGNSRSLIIVLYAFLSILIPNTDVVNAKLFKNDRE